MTVTEARNLYLKKAFLRFLKENNCYKQYINNINNKKIINMLSIDNINLNDLLNFHGHYFNNSLFYYSFEGYDFWKKISLLWDACRIVTKEELITDGLPCYIYYNKINFNVVKIVLKQSKIIKLRLLYEKIIFNLKHKRKLKKNITKLKKL